MNVHNGTEPDHAASLGMPPEQPAPAFLQDMEIETCSTVSNQILRRQQAVVAMGRRAVATPDASLLLQDAAALIAEMLDAEFSAVAEVASNGAVLLARLASRVPEGEQPRLVTRELPAGGDHSLAAYALQVAHPVLSADLFGETRFQDCFLRGFGVRNALAVPLRVLDRAFGVLVACSVEPRRFHSEDLLFAEVIGHLTVTSIARSQVERTLAEQQSLTQQCLDTVEALVLVLDPSGRIQRANRECERITGFSEAELRERPIWNVFATPAESELYQAMFARLCRGEKQVAYECSLFTKHAEKRQIRWSSSALPDSQGGIRAVVATGIDVTEQHLARQLAQVARAAPSPLPIDLPDGMLSQLFSLQKDSVADASVAAPSPQPKERRQQPRRPYSYRQKVAPIVDGKLPSRKAFREVQCYDIAAGGIAYLTEQRPESDLLVLALGAPPRITYLIAQVVHVTTIVQDGKQYFKIGCKYTGRAPY